MKHVLRIVVPAIVIALALDGVNRATAARSMAALRPPILAHTTEPPPPPPPPPPPGGKELP